MGAIALAALTAALALAPIAAWLTPPSAPLAAVLAGCVAIVAAVHGLGRAVARAIDDPDAPAPLVIAWGLGAWLLIGGVLTSFGAYTADNQRVLAVVSIAVGAAWCAGRAAQLTRWRPEPPSLMSAVGAIALALVALHLLGSAATWSGSYRDADGFLLGPLRRLGTTGQLGDAVGLPRTAGLGGNVVLYSLAEALGDLRTAHVIDRGLGYALALALMLMGDTRSRTRPFVALSLIAVASSTPEFIADLAPRWLVVAAAFAILHGWRRATSARQRLGSVVVAIGLSTMIHAGIGLTIALIGAVSASASGAERRRVVAIAGALFAVALVAYALAARAVTEPDVPSALALLPRGLIVRVIIWSALAAVAHALARLATRRDGDAALAMTLTALAVAAASAGILVPSPASAWTQVQPIGISLLLLVFEVALTVPARRGLTPATVVTASLLALILAITRFPTGWPPRSWEDRLVDQVEAVRTMARRTSPATDDRLEAEYRAALATIPRGARVGLWVDRPDLVDYRHHHVLDLYSLDGAACSAIPGGRWWRRSTPACRRFGATLNAAHLDFLVVTAQAVPRAENWMIGPLCRLYRRATCDDPLAALLRRTTNGQLDANLTVIPLTASTETSP